MASLLSLQRAATCTTYRADNFLAWAEALASLGRIEETALVLDRWTAIDPGNAYIGYCRGTLLPGPPLAQLPETIVTDEFDSFADSFDRVLHQLDYRVPHLLRGALDGNFALAATLDVLDLGCGTGLCGAVARPFARRLVGVDLSAAMIAKARHRGAYDDLVVDEIMRFMAGTAERFDLVIAGDCLVYVGELEKLAASLTRVIRPSGIAILTFELGEPDEAYVLQPCGRYRHGARYAQTMLEQHGLAIVDMVTAPHRKELGALVAGIMITARRPAEA